MMFCWVDLFNVSEHVSYFPPIRHNYSEWVKINDLTMLLDWVDRFNVNEQCSSEQYSEPIQPIPSSCRVLSQRCSIDLFNCIESTSSISRQIDEQPRIDQNRRFGNAVLLSWPIQWNVQVWYFPPNRHNHSEWVEIDDLTLLFNRAVELHVNEQVRYYPPNR